MKKLITFILICFSSNAISQECYLQDWEALKGLYLSTNGDNWTDTTGWTYIKNATGPNVECPLSAIFGVALGITDSFIIEGRGTITLKSVTHIFVYDNNLTGGLDSTIGNFPYLEYLELSENEMSGAIPKEIGNLASLEVMLLELNNFSGPIPFEFSNLKLDALTLSSNQLTGNPLLSLPDANFLKFLELDNNLFEANVAHLDRPNAHYETLDLSHNNFYGSLPASLAHDQYHNIDLSFTNISGCLKSAFSIMCSMNEENMNITDHNEIITSWADFCAYGKGTCIQCSFEINLDSPTDDFNRGKGEYLTPGYDSIYATNKLTGDVNMLYNAGSVLLEPGFQADAGTVFEAKTGGCGFP